MKSIKIVLINILVLLSILFLSNILAYVYLKSFTSWNKPKNVDNRANLIVNGKSDSYNKLVLTEFENLGYEYKSYIGWSRLPFNGETTNINNEGDRVTPCEECIYSDSSRVIRFFGGSTMWGTGADDWGTIPYYFNKINQTYEVFNHGESAFSSRNNLSRLINLINQNKIIEDVVFYDGYNDIFHICGNELRFNAFPQMDNIRNHVSHSLNSNRFKFIFINFFKRIFAFYSIELIKFKKSENALPYHMDDKNFICCENDSATEKVARTIINNWKIAKDIVESKGGNFLAVLQPSPFIANNIFHPDYILDASECRINTYMDIYNIIISKVGNENWFLDLSMVFDGLGPFYIDDIHISNEGNKIVANKISTFINK